MDMHEIESCPAPEVASINIMSQLFASTRSEGTLADVEKAFMQEDSSVRRERVYAEVPQEGLPHVPEGASIRLDREVRGVVNDMSVWRVAIRARNCCKKSSLCTCVRIQHMPLEDVVVTKGDTSHSRTIHTEDPIRHVFLLCGAKAPLGSAPRGNMARQVLETLPKAGEGAGKRATSMTPANEELCCRDC